MKAITFLLNTHQPILATSFQGDPNSDVSYSYIPGSMIRGVLINRYLKVNSDNLQNFDILKDETVNHLFFDGTTCYLNAYLSSQNSKRMFPTVLSWRKEKGAEVDDLKGMKVYDFSFSNDDIKSPKSLGEYFWIKENGYIRIYQVERRINIHHKRNRQKGRSTQTEGEIFRYDAIDKGQTFQGVILIDDNQQQTGVKTIEEIITDLLKPSDIWLGGSRSAGYGHAEITEIESHNSWYEIGIPPEQRVNYQDLKITLLSDMILRDEYGQYVARPPQNILGIKLKYPKICYMNSTLIGGFNRKWGLPLPQVQAVAAGSVFIYENVSLTLDQIKQLESEGLGERTTEGFGRIAVNWLTQDSEFTVKLPEFKSKRNNSLIKLEDKESCVLAKKMAERILIQRLDRYLIEKIDDYKIQRNGIKNSQLSRLIIVTQKSLEDRNLILLDNLIDQLPSNAETQYKKAKIDNQSLEKTIKDWLKNPREWIQKSIEPVVIADQQADLTDELALEYTFRLIIAIAKNATKETPNE